MTENYIQGKQKMTTKKSRCTSYYTIIKNLALLALVLTSGLVLPSLFSCKSGSVGVKVDSLKGSNQSNSTIDDFTTSNFQNNNVKSQLDQSWQLGHSVKVDYIAKNFTVKDNMEDPVNYFGFESKFGSFTLPVDLAVDKTYDQPYLYVCDEDAHKIMKYHKNGTFILEWGSFGTGNGQFRYPRGVGVDSSYVYVVDRVNHRVQRFDKDGTYSIQWGSLGTGNGQFTYPEKVACDGTYVYVTDTDNNRVQKFQQDGTYVTKWGSTGSGNGQFDNPIGIATDGSNVFVADTYNHRIQKFTTTGTYVSKWGSWGDGNGQFMYPVGVEVDDFDSVYASDDNHNDIQQFTKSGSFILRFGGGGSEDGEFSDPYGISVDDTHIYIADKGNDRVQKIILTAYDEIKVSNIYNILISDGNYAKFEYLALETPMYAFNTTLIFIMYDLAYPSVAGLKFKLDVIDDGSLENAINETTLTNTFSSSSSYGFNQLILYVHVGFSVAYGYSVKLVFLDTGTGQIKTVSKLQGDVDRITKLMFYFDYVWVQSTPVIMNPRFDYLYTSVDSGLMRLFIEVYEYQIPIKIYTDYILSSINPDAITGRDSTDTFLWVNNTVPLSYLLLFKFESPKHYLAIEEKTSTYLQDIGFEGGWQNDWDSFDFTNIGLNSTIVSDGAFSLRGSRSSLGYSYLKKAYNKYLPPGYYYFSFNAYVETWEAGGWGFQLGIYNKSGNSWFYPISVDYTITDRWITEFGYFHITGSSSGYNIVFRLYYNGVVFLDNIKIWQVNHEVETSGYRKIKVSGQLISWDGYDNPSVPNEDIELELRDRTADSSIVSDSTKTTDPNGNFEWEVDTSSYSELQDQREIEVRSYSLENRFYNSLANEFENQLSSYTFSGATGSFSEESDYFKGEVSGDNDWSIQVQPTSSNFDISNFDVLYFEIKANTTYTLNSIRTLGNWDGGGYPDFNYAPDISVTTSWQTFSKQRYDMNEDRSPDDSDVDRTLFISAETKELTIYIRNCHYLQAQKSYFTPIPATDYQYFYETDPNDNEWDFSEETTEGYAYQSGATTTLSSSDGYLKLEPDSSLNYANIRVTSLSVDSSEYPKAQIRIKGSEANIRFAFWDGVATLTSYTTITTSYETYTMTLDADWSGTETQFGLSIAEVAGDGYYEGTEAYYIDDIRLIHRDTPSISTADSYAWCSSSNNSFTYRVEHDESLLGYYNDLQIIYLNQSVGIHNVTVIPFNDLDRNLVFLSGSSIESIFEVKNPFMVYIESYSVSSSYVDLYITASRSGNYYIFENNSQVGSGSFLSVGTNIYHLKNITAGILVNLAYKFTNNSDIVWFNTSYSNIEFIVQTSDFADSSEKAWSLWVRPTYTCSYIIYQNQSNIGSGTVSSQGVTLSKLKSIEPGLYWINISFTYQSEVIWVNNSYYISPLTAYPQILSTPSNQDLEWGSTLDLIWLLDRLHQWELYKNGSVVSSSQTSNPRYTIPSSLAIAVYNYTLLVENQYENQNSSTVFITVKDTTAPTYQVSNMNNSFFEDQETDTSIIFTVNENVSVSAYRNTSLVYSGYTNTSFSVAISSVAKWNITIILTDNHSNSLSNTLFYTIRDLTKPEFYNYDSEKTITMGSTIELTTYVTELNPHKYYIMYGTQEIASGSYTNQISYSYQFQYRGTYHYFIYANDTSGNLNYLHIIVTVTSAQSAGIAPVDTGIPGLTTSEPTFGFEILIVLLGVIVVIQRRKKK